MKSWWERFPGRLDREIQSLDAYGIKHTRDEAAWRDGQFVLNLVVEHEGRAPLQLVAYYPDTFPYMRFEVLAPTLNLNRHQNPFTKNLCLLGRATENWDVAFTLGNLLTEQMPTLLRFRNEKADALRALEEPQGEPFSDYYSYFLATAVLVDSSWTIDPDANSGRLQIVYDEVLPFRGAVVEVQGADRAVLARADHAFDSLFQKTCAGRWVRWHEHILENDPGKILSLLYSKYNGLQPNVRALSQKRAAQRGEPDVIGVIYPEEVAQGQNGDGWLFIVRSEGRALLARACRSGRVDLGSRAPELSTLPAKKIAIIGLGTLGSPSAMELSRSGVGVLNLADFDYVEAGTIARWPLGVSAIGRRKVDAIREFLAKNYPFTEIEVFCGMVGGALYGADYRDAHDLERLLDVDLIFDATAERGIQHFLSDVAVELGKPYICISATPGAWGGLIFRKRPGDPACWSCLQHAMNEGAIPTPPSDPDGMLQPIGCASSTFTGAGFELQQVVLMGVRTAVSTICAGEPNAFPESSWNVAVGRFRDPDGAIIAPHWETFTIGQHASCENEIAHRTPLDS